LELVEKLIHQAKAKGYTFATVAPLLQQTDPRPQHVEPSLADRATLLTLQGWWIAPGYVLSGMYWFGGLIFVMTLLSLVLALINERPQRRRLWPVVPDDEMPFVSVVLAGYNEEKVVARTLAH